MVKVAMVGVIVAIAGVIVAIAVFVYIVNEREKDRAGLAAMETKAHNCRAYGTTIAEKAAKCLKAGRQVSPDWHTQIDGEFRHSLACYEVNKPALVRDSQMLASCQTLIDELPCEQFDKGKWLDSPSCQ